MTLITRRRAIAALSTVALAGVAGCGGSSDSSDGGEAVSSKGSKATLSLVAYSTPQVVYDELIPEFVRTEAGSGVGFRTSFGASGDQSRAVAAGQKADVVSFSIEPDVTRLEDEGLIEAGTAQKVSTSQVSFVVRKGNPKNIRTWDDLIKPGVKVLTPNPFTSGAAKWNLLGAYAYGGIEYTEKLLKDNVEVQDKSGREALQNFTSGTGDVLLSYEYEGKTAQKKGEDVDIVVPPDSVQIDILIAKLKKAPEQAQSFIDYVVSDEGQRYFTEWGYDPPSGPVNPAKTLKTIDDLGGWKKVNKDLFDPENGSIAKIEEGLGVQTAK